MKAFPTLVAALALASAACVHAQAPVSMAAQVLERQILQRHALHRLHLEPIDTEAGEGADKAAVTKWDVAASDEALRHRMSVLLKGRSSEGRDVLLRLSFKVDATVLAWRTAQDVEVSQAFGESLATREEVDAVLHPDAVQAESLAGYRSKLSLPAGRVLRERDVADAETLLRGDAVRVEYRAGPIVIQTRGQVLDPARVGQRVRVAIGGSREPVRALVMDAGQVRVLAMGEEQ